MLTVGFHLRSEPERRARAKAYGSVPDNVFVTIDFDPDGDASATAYLTTEQADDLAVELAAASFRAKRLRVELSPDPPGFVEPEPATEVNPG